MPPGLKADLNFLDILSPQEMFQRNGKALYTQFADLLRQKIESGLLKPGSRLPNMNIIAAHYDISRITVRQAVQILVSEGYLSSRQGRGVEVCGKLPKKDQQRLQTSWRAMVKRVENATVELIEEDNRRECPLITSDMLPVSVYHFMRRVHIKNNLRFAYIDIYLDRQIYERAPDRFNSTTVIPVMDELNIKIVNAWQELTICQASPEIAFHLEIPCGAPVAHVRRFACDDRKKAVYAADMYHPGEKVKFDIELIK